MVEADGLPPVVRVYQPLIVLGPQVVRALWRCDYAVTNFVVRKRARKVRCWAVATVSAAELVTFPTISEDAHPMSSHLCCELVAGHDDSHVALVAIAHGGDQWWWLRWDGKVGELIQIDPCDAELPQGRYADDCLLPEGHRGPHSFDLRPPSSLPGNAIPSAVDPHIR